MIIQERSIGKPEDPVFIIAEISANHGQDLEKAKALVRAAKDAGADAIKLQTYTADTITLDCKTPEFQIKGGLWDGAYLHDLYQKAYTPWEWHEALAKEAEMQGLIWFSSPFDFSSVDFLEGLNCPIYKIASFELTDIALIKRVAKTKKPIIMSTGMGTLEEVHAAMAAIRGVGDNDVILLKCTSAYPAPYESMNLRRLHTLRETFKVPVGLSDHSLGVVVPIASVSLGAKVIEKHIVLDAEDDSPDAAFSLTPDLFKSMVDEVRRTEAALGHHDWSLSKKELENQWLRRSLYVAQEIKAGECLTAENIRSVRPAHGLPTEHYEAVIGKTATQDLAFGTPLSWEHLG